jgi:Fe-S cluster biogenesis protein NfuA
VRPKPSSAPDDVALLESTQGSRAATAKSALHEQIAKLCRDVLAPLVRADEGVLYLVTATAEDVHIHLGGACAGCPGAAVTRDRMFGPAIKSLAPKANVRVTTGFRVPEGAEKVE